MLWYHYNSGCQVCEKDCSSTYCTDLRTKIVLWWYIKDLTDCFRRKFHELDNCELSTLETMLSNRGVSQKEDIGGDALKKTNMIEKLRQIRNYNETCCICLSQFTSLERIRVLPNCKHEFHSVCIVKWASTFAANERFCRKGKPTCPLDNTHIGEVKCCSPVKTPWI